MKAHTRSIFTLILLLFSIISIYAADEYVSRITLDKDNQQLIAPVASSYRWYLNGEQIQNSSRTIDIESPGTYDLVLFSPEGGEYSASISVGIAADGEVFTVYVIGDSTAANYTDYWYPQTGWGMVLQHFFDSEHVIVENKALGGTSSRSFYNSFWPDIRDNLLQPGDMVLIQFGINDRANDDERNTTFEEFKAFLTSYVNETKAKGAHPVILSTVRRNSWVSPTEVYDSYHEHPVAARELAGEIGVPLIDIDQIEEAAMIAVGQDYTGPFWYLYTEPGEYPDGHYSGGKEDQVHFQEMGAIEICREITEAIEAATDDTILNRLIPYIKPRYEVAVSSNISDAQTMLSVTETFPEGINVTVKAKYNSSWDLVEWQDGLGETFSEKDLTMFTMGAENLSLTAILDDEPVPDCIGVLNGKAYIDDCGDCIGGTTGIPPCTSILTSGTFRMTSIRSELCIQDGEEITQEECTPLYSQHWEIIQDGSYYKLRNLESGRYLTSDTLLSRTRVATGNDELMWRFEEIGTDTFQLSPKDDHQLILETYGSRPGQYIRLYTRNSATSQRFMFPLATRKQKVTWDQPQYKIVPNPTHFGATLEFNAMPENFIELKVYNLQGKQVFQKSGNFGNRLSFGQDLPEGMYFVEVSSGDYIQIRKMLKY